MAIEFTPEEIDAAGRKVLLADLQSRSIGRFRDTRTELVRLLGLLDSPSEAPQDWDQRLQDLFRDLRQRYAKVVEVRAATKSA